LRSWGLFVGGKQVNRVPG